MANTTDILITVFFDEDAIGIINRKTGLDLKQVTDGGKSGGTKVLSFECYGTCVRCIGREEITSLIEAFHGTYFDNPEFAVLLIYDDNENFSGAVHHKSGEITS